ncbi:MAG: hypothetical protein NXI10_05515 [bacterium]|nr:hypothetical protein [bacterium]
MLIKHWIDWDCDLWVELEFTEIEILKQRFVYELTFKEIAQINKSSVIKMRMAFEAIMRKLRKSHNTPIVELLREYDDCLESKADIEGLPVGLDYYHHWLN